MIVETCREYIVEVPVPRIPTVLALPMKQEQLRPH